MTTPTVYIPTLDGGNRLAICLNALRNQTLVPKVVVADNGPFNGCRDLIESSFPEVERVGFGRNLGFGPALNRAIAQAGSGPIILLNDDAVPEPNFTKNLMQRVDEAEMLAAVLVRERDPRLIDSAGIAVDQTLMAFDYLSGESLVQLESAVSPIGPTGGAALYSRNAFEAVGGFDERIFLYYEDLDLALRIRQTGGRCKLAGDARATHGFSATLGSRNPLKYARTGWSRGYLLRRYGIMRNPRVVAGVFGRELVICGGQMLRDRTTAGLRGRIRGWRDARNLSSRALPADAISKMSTRQALEIRRKRGSN